MERHPDQPLIKDDNGIVRFKENKIVSYLVDKTGILNDLPMMNFSREDRVQLTQLIGYSLDGYAELSYVSDEDYDRAAKTAGE